MGGGGEGMRGWFALPLISECVGLLFALDPLAGFAALRGREFRRCSLLAPVPKSSPFFWMFGGKAAGGVVMAAMTIVAMIAVGGGGEEEAAEERRIPPMYMAVVQRFESAQRR
jgi:hypothetical protein